MCSYISNAGHTPIVAENGETALQILDDSKVDMVIMDVEMPGLDGFETTRCIRDWFGDYWIPIIFVTGKNAEQDLRQGIDAGGDDYLIKPISETILAAKIRAISERDGLTHLYNRRTFDERANDQWRIAMRTKEPLAILLMDIDHFKAYNDYYGHIAGDECITEVAGAIEEALSRPGDLIARYGGEEFIALLPNTREDGAYHVAERIRMTVQQLGIKHRESATNASITLSIGGAVVTHTTGTLLKDLTNAADKALYTAKQTGRNRVTVKLFTPKTTVLVAQSGPSTIKAIDGKLDNHCGVSAAREIRKHPLTSHTPIVMLVDEMSDRFITPSQGIEAEACFVKPVAENDIVLKLNELLF